MLIFVICFNFNQNLARSDKSPVGSTHIYNNKVENLTQCKPKKISRNVELHYLHISRMIIVMFCYVIWLIVIHTCRLYYSADTRHILSLSSLLLSRHKTHTIHIVSTTQPTQDTYYPYRLYYSADTRHIIPIVSTTQPTQDTYYPYRLYYSANTRHIIPIVSTTQPTQDTYYPYRLYYSVDTRHILSLSSLLLSWHKTHTIPIWSLLFWYLQWCWLIEKNKILSD
jgi:hypothetical protein